MSKSHKAGKANTSSGRDAHGRWQKGHCPNPKGRPKIRRTTLSESDIYRFKNTLVEFRTNRGTETKTREAVLLNKIFADAMNGKVSAQRMMMKEFKTVEEDQADLRAMLLKLHTQWFPPGGLPKGNEIPDVVPAMLTALAGEIKAYFSGYAEDADGDDTTPDE